MKITKRTREQAALLCSIAASNFDDSIGTTAMLLDAEYDARALAWDAQAAACLSFGTRELDARYFETYAEAEALLRCGWRPR